MDRRQSDFKYNRNEGSDSITLLLDLPVARKYHIPVSRLGQLSKTIGEKYPNASEWGAHLYRKNVVSRAWMLEFRKLVQKLAPYNSINWDSTERYYDAQDEELKATLLSKSNSSKHRLCTIWHPKRAK